jgi:hypothetical protein
VQEAFEDLAAQYSARGTKGAAFFASMAKLVSDRIDRRHGPEPTDPLSKAVRLDDARISAAIEQVIRLDLG